MNEPLPSSPTPNIEPPAGDARRDDHVRTDEDTTPDLAQTAGYTALPGERPAAAALFELPGYEVLCELGRGGMGVVYKARHKELKRLVALKFLPPGALADRVALSRFRVEAEAMAGLQHPHIVQVYEVGEHEGRPFFALELLDGGTLAERLADDPLPPRAAAALVETLARATQHAHERGVIHRDLKPANVLFQGSGVRSQDSGVRNSASRTGGKGSEVAADGTEQGRRPSDSCLPPDSWIPKISDFGLAKKLDVDEGQTRTGQVLGTPSYMAPEQAAGQGKLVGPAVDVYALGAILYSCLVGRPPFKGATVLDTLEQVRTVEPVPPRRLQPRVPLDLDTICLKCLQKDARQRYPSADELANDLRRFLDGQVIQARPLGLARRVARWARRRPALAALLALSALAVLAGFSAVLWHNRELGQALASVEAERLEADRQARSAREAEKRRRRQQFIAEMNLALRAWNDGQTDQVLELLARQVPEGDEEDLRGFEWDYLWAACHGDRATLSGHTRIVGQVAIAPDGRTLASVSGFGASEGTGELFVWDLAAGKRGGRALDDAPLSAVAYSPDGTRLATMSFRGMLRVYEAATLKELAAWQAAVVGTRGLAFTPDGREVVAYGGESVQRMGVVFWDAASGSRRRFFPIKGTVGKTALSPDCATFYFGAGPDLRRIDLKDGKELPALKGTAKAVVSCVAVAPNGKRVAAGYAHGQVAVWDLERQVVRTLTAHGAGVGSVAFAHDSGLLITVSDDKTVKVWADKVLPQATIRGHTHGVYACAVSQDGKTLITGGGAEGVGEVKVWDFPPDREWDMLPHPKSLILDNAQFFSAGRALMTSQAGANEVRHWDAASAELLRTHSLAKGVFTTCFAVAPDGCAAIGDSEGAIWRTKGDEAPSPMQKAHAASIQALAFSPDGAILASISADGLKLWNAAGKLLATLPAPKEEALRLTFSPDGAHLASCHREGMIYLWDIPGRRLHRSWKAHTDMVLSLAFSTKGDRLASGGRDSLAHVWDVRSGDKVLTLPRHARVIKSLLFCPDGKSLVSGDANRVRLWDLATGQERASYAAVSNSVIDMAFTADGKTLLAVGSSYVVQRWSTSPRRRAWP